MRNECNIIRDILPLYLEGIVSADTAGFVESHLQRCAGCRAEWEHMKDSGGLDKAAAAPRDQEVMPLKAFSGNGTEEKE